MTDHSIPSAELLAQADEVLYAVRYLVGEGQKRTLAFELPMYCVVLMAWLSHTHAVKKAGSNEMMNPSISLSPTSADFNRIAKYAVNIIRDHCNEELRKLERGDDNLLNPAVTVVPPSPRRH